jgi:plasmid stabilization system protein ParE
LIRFTRSALADIQQAIVFLEQRNVKAADALRAQFVTEFERIEKFPETGRYGRVAGTREKLVAGTHFVVAYRLARGDIHILAVRHSRRLWPARFNE